MEKKITLESIKNKTYEEMTYEERQFFCEHGHLLSEGTEFTDGIIFVDDIEEYKRVRGIIDFNDLETKLNFNEYL